MTKELRLIVLTQGGTELAIRRLTQLDCAEVVAVFVETEIVRRKGLRESLKRSIRYDGYKLTAWKLVRKLFGLSGVYDHDINAITQSRDRLRQMNDDLSIPIHFVSDLHSQSSLDLIRSADADLGVVLATNILKESVFKIPRLGSINVHQGLAPYYRGCPSVFWELYNGEREVGLTVHFVESKVDSGEIILQRTVPLQYDYSYGLNYEAFIGDYRHKLIVPCANLLAEAVRMLAEGAAEPRPQDLNVGTRYRQPIKREKDEMRRRLRKRRAQESSCPVPQSSGD